MNKVFCIKRILPVLSLVLGVIVMVQPFFAMSEAERVAEQARRYCWVGLLFWFSLFIAAGFRLREARAASASLRRFLPELLAWVLCVAAAVVYPAILVTGVPLDTQRYISRYYDFFLIAPLLSVVVLVLVFFTSLSRGGKALLWAVSAVGAMGVMRLLGHYIGDVVR